MIRAYSSSTGLASPSEIKKGGTKSIVAVYCGETKVWPEHNFWGWASPSTLGNRAYRNKRYYQEVYRPQFDPHVTTAFAPGTVQLDQTPVFFHERWRSIFDEAAPSENSWSLPSFEDKRNDFSVVFSGYTGGTASFSVTRLNAVSMKQVYEDNRQAWAIRRYETRWPIATATTDTIILPPGEYSFKNAKAFSYGRRFTQYVNTTNRIYSFVRLLGATKYCLMWQDSDYPQGTGADDDGMIKTTSPLRVAMRCELGGGYGAAGGTETLTWAPKLTRQIEGYSWSCRVGQLRGRLNTEPDGSGREYRYVYNDKRVSFTGFDGEWNVDPTVCIDPETGEYVPVEVKALEDTSTEYNAGMYWTYIDAYFYNGETGIGSYNHEVPVVINVEFRDDYILIRKYADALRPTAEMRLYYIEGSPEYGGMIDPNTGEMVE